MFKKKTVFILGAGASKPYRYPLGSDLIEQIIINIENDTVHLPRLTEDPSRPYYYNTNNGTKDENRYFFKDFKNGFKIIDVGNISTQNLTQLFTATYLTSTSFTPHSVELNQINEFFKFKELLQQHDPVSIDNFLRDFPTYAEVGKIMIIYSLLKCEIKNYFYHNQNDGNWYSSLFNDLCSGLTDANDILKSTCNFITFNYDISLDFYLCNRLNQTERFSALGEKFIENSRIHHVYGTIHDITKIGSYGHFATPEPKCEDTLHNTKRFIYALQNQQNIRTIDEERKGHDDRVQQLIKYADEIIIIGFGFDSNNLNILGFPCSLGEYFSSEMYQTNGLFYDKTIKWFNFMGEMTNVQRKFEAMSITVHPHAPRIIISKLNNIKKAYDNDFKESLYG